MKFLLKNKYSSNFLWIFFEKLTNLVSVLIIGFFLARYLGPENYGTLTYSQSFIGLFSFLIGLGLDNITVREIVKRPILSKIIVSTSFVLKLIVFILIFGLVNIINFYTKDTNQVKLIVLVVSLILIQYPFTVFVNYFQAIVKIKFISMFMVISKLVLIFVKILLIYKEAPLISFVLLDSIVIAFLSASYFFYYKKWINGKHKDLFKFNKKIARKMLKDSWPLMISSGAIMLYMRLDQIMIKEMLSLKDLGHYSVSVKISESWYFIPMIISSVLFPSVVKAKKTGVQTYNKRLKQLFFMCGWVSIFFSLFLFFFSEQVIFLLFGNQFFNAITSLSILSLSGFFVAIGYVNGKWMVVENYTKLSLFRNLLGLAVNIICNLFLIPKYGINGAAISTLLAIFVASNFFFLFYEKTRRIFFIQNTSLFYFNFFKK